MPRLLCLRGRRSLGPVTTETAVRGGGKQSSSVSAQKGSRYSNRPSGCHSGLWGGIWENTGAVETSVLFRKQSAMLQHPWQTDKGNRLTSNGTFLGLLQLFNPPLGAFYAAWNEKVLLCLITSRARSVLTAQTASGRLLLWICQNTDSATGTGALFPAVDLWHLIVCTATFSTEQLPPIHDSYQKRILLIKAPFSKAFGWWSSPLRSWYEACLLSNFTWLWMTPCERGFSGWDLASRVFLDETLRNPSSAERSSLPAAFHALPRLRERGQQWPGTAGSSKLWCALGVQIWLLVLWSVKGLWHVVHRWTDALFGCQIKFNLYE